MTDRARPVAPIADAIAAIERGEIVVVVDDEDRENEGDLIMAAEFATPEKIAFYVRHTSGVICVALTGERATSSSCPSWWSATPRAQRTAFTDSVDLIQGTSTGISAGDRAPTIRALADSSIASPTTWPDPVTSSRCAPGRRRADAGRPHRGAVDLARLAGLRPAGVLCEIVNDDGSMARVPDLERFCAQDDLLLISIADLIRHRRRTEQLVHRVGEATLPTPWGPFRCVAYRVVARRRPSTWPSCRATSAGRPGPGPGALASASPATCSARCAATAGRSCDTAMAAIATEGRGVVVYLRGHEGRGIGVGHKIRATACRTRASTPSTPTSQLGLPVDNREYGIGAQILAELGVHRMRLMTNNPAKYGGLEGFGLEIVERLPIQVEATPENARYLPTSEIGSATCSISIPPSTSSEARDECPEGSLRARVCGSGRVLALPRLHRGATAGRCHLDARAPRRGRGRHHRGLGPGIVRDPGGRPSAGGVGFVRPWSPWPRSSGRDGPHRPRRRPGRSRRPAGRPRHGGPRDRRLLTTDTIASRSSGPAPSWATRGPRPRPPPSRWPRS